MLGPLYIQRTVKGRCIGQCRTDVNHSEVACLQTTKRRTGNSLYNFVRLVFGR